MTEEQMSEQEAGIEVSNITSELVTLACERDARGRAKYGKTLDRADLSASDWIQHTVEELLDGAGYLLALRRSLASPPDDLAALRGRVRELEAALRFYSTKENYEKEWQCSDKHGEGAHWKDSVVQKDHGSVARAALASGGLPLG